MKVEFINRVLKLSELLDNAAKRMSEDDYEFSGADIQYVRMKLVEFLNTEVWE